jgi:hypothetical protein
VAVAGVVFFFSQSAEVVGSVQDKLGQSNERKTRPKSDIVCSRLDNAGSEN